MQVIIIVGCTQRQGEGGRAPPWSWWQLVGAFSRAAHRLNTGPGSLGGGAPAKSERENGSTSAGKAREPPPPTVEGRQRELRGGGGGSRTGGKKGQDWAAKRMAKRGANLGNEVGRAGKARPPLQSTEGLQCYIYLHVLACDADVFFFPAAGAAQGS